MSQCFTSPHYWGYFISNRYWVWWCETNPQKGTCFSGFHRSFHPNSTGRSDRRSEHRGSKKTDCNSGAGRMGVPRPPLISDHLGEKCQISNGLEMVGVIFPWINRVERTVTMVKKLNKIPPAPEVQGAWSSGWHKSTKVQVYLGGGLFFEKTSCFW